MKHDHCVACGSKENLTQHHLVPRSIGGSDEDSNLLTLCGTCHAKAHGHNAAWRTSELVRKALQAKKARGERTGAIPYGSRCEDGTNLIPDADEQDSIAQALQLQAEGMSLRGIAARLTALGKTSRGSAWHPQTVRNILSAASA